MKTRPTTTPAAMAPLFDPLGFDPDAASAELLAVTTMVEPPTVTTDGLAEVVDEGVFDGVGDEVVESEPEETVPEPVR